MLQDAKYVEAKEGPLSDFDERFIQEYLIDLDPAEAFRRCGRQEGDIAKTAACMLKRPEIRAGITKAMEERMIRTHVTQDRVLSEIAAIAFSNLEDFADWNAGTVTIRDSRAVPRSKKAAVQEIKETVTPAGTTVSLKLYNKQPSLDLLAKHLGMLNDKLEVSMAEDTARVLNEARERVINARRAETTYEVLEGPPEGGYEEEAG